MGEKPAKTSLRNDAKNSRDGVPGKAEGKLKIESKTDDVPALLSSCEKPKAGMRHVEKLFRASNSCEQAVLEEVVFTF